MAAMVAECKEPTLVLPDRGVIIPPSPNRTCVCPARNRPAWEKKLQMEATLDLTQIFQQPNFDVNSYRALRELAFANPESFDRFATLVSNLENKVATDRASSATEALKIGVCYRLLDERDSALEWLQK